MKSKVYVLLLRCSCGMVLTVAMYIREPTCLKDVLLLLKRNGIKIPETDEEWAEASRNSICIRRSLVLQDGLKEVSKSRFDPTMLLNVCVHVIIQYCWCYCMLVSPRMCHEFLALIKSVVSTGIHY